MQWNGQAAGAKERALDDYRSSHPRGLAIPRPFGLLARHLEQPAGCPCLAAFSAIRMMPGKPCRRAWTEIMRGAIRPA